MKDGTFMHDSGSMTSVMSMIKKRTNP